jgi:SAM domain (Sterile alpha motif)
MDVAVWLRSLGLGKYEAAFRENEIDETVLLSLTHETLKERAPSVQTRRTSFEAHEDHGKCITKALRKMVEGLLCKIIAVCVIKKQLSTKIFLQLSCIQVCNVEVPLTISYSAHWVVVDRRCAVGCATVRGELQC